jgi:two-component system LytT family response regulator
LIKPISPKKLARAIGRLQELQNPSQTTQSQNKISDDRLGIDESIFVRDGEHCFFIPLFNIERFDSHGNYCRIFFLDQTDNTQKSVFLYKSLTKVESRLPTRQFFRNNRQQIINVSSVISVEVWVNGGLKIQLKSGEETEVSRRNTSRFKQIFSI